MCWWVYVFFFFFSLSFFFFFGGGRGLGWVVLFKIPWSIYLMLFRVTNLSALLLPYFTVMLFFLLLHGSGNQLVFFFSYFSAGLSGNDVHSLASSFILAFSHFPALFFNQHKYLLVPAAMQVNIYYVIFTKHCCMYMILSWLRLGSGGPCLYVFFFHPTRPKHREIKMEKQKQKKKKEF